MNLRIKIWLGSILTLQLVIIVAVFSIKSDNYQPKNRPLLVNLEQGAIDRIELTDAKELVKLNKNDGQWRLPSSNNLLVDKTKIENLLSTLKRFRQTWPVAKTNGSQQRFEVDKDKFKRHLSLYHGDQLKADLYIGTSPGFRQSYVRMAGQDEVYALNINIVDLPTSEQQWLDKDQLSITPIDSIVGKDFYLHKKEGRWTLADAKQSKPSSEIEQQQANQLAGRFSGLKINSLSDKTIDQSQGITAISGKRHLLYTYQEKDGKYLIQRNDINAVFEISKTLFEALTKTDFKSFVPAKKKEEGQVEPKSKNKVGKTDH